MEPFKLKSNKYLIRKQNLTFLGPYSFSQLKRKARNLDFFAADEISRGFGKWIRIDDMSRLKRHYPELVDFSKDFLAGWGVSNHTNDIQEITRSKDSSAKSGVGFLKYILVALLLITGVGVYLKKNNPQTYDQLLTTVKLRTDHIKKLEKFDTTQSLTPLADYLKVHKKAILKEAVRNRSTCLLYTSPSPRDKRQSRMPSSA